MDENKTLTPEQAGMIARYLAHQFPWLTDDEEAEDFPSGSDVIEQLASIHSTLQKVAGSQL